MMPDLDLSIAPLAGHPETPYHPHGEHPFNDRVRAVVATQDSAMLAPTPPPSVRAAKNYLNLFLRPWLWWGNHRNGGQITTVAAGAQWAYEQGATPPIDLHHGDTVRIDPEPWSRFAVFGGES